MTDEIKNINEEEEEEITVYTLTDEETGEEQDFELLAEATLDGKLYYAMALVDDESGDYEILAVNEDGDDILFSSVDDDEEFERVADYFDNLFDSEEDYDN